MKINTVLLAALLFCCAFMQPSLAQNNIALRFEELPKPEQDLLKAASHLWPKLDTAAQTQLRAQAQHWLKLDDAKRRALLQLQKNWDALPYKEKTLHRSRFAAWQSLGATEQAKINATYSQWQKLSTEKQQALKAKFAQQLPEYQAAWLLGPSLGSETQALQEWLLFIPDEQLKPWLMCLRELKPHDRSALIQLGKRMKANERDTFRTRLISAPATARADMIENGLK
jgi:hypothetical protein